MSTEGAEALGLRVAVDRTSLSPGARGGANLVVDIVAKGRGAGWQRPALSVYFVLDVSASMKGPPLEHLVQSVEKLAMLLSPSDHIGIITFSHGAEEVLPLSAATEEAKRLVQGALHALSASAVTNMEAGLRLALERLPPRREGERQLILLLSDGVPNVGRCTPLTLAELGRTARGRASVWTLGYGPHHQEDILLAISDAASGRYEYIPRPQIAEFIFGKVLGAQGAVVAESIELILRPAAGLQIDRVVGKHETRFGADGLVVSLPDLFADTHRLFVAEISAGAGLRPPTTASLQLGLRYRVLPGGEMRHTGQELKVPITSHAGALVEAPRGEVLLARIDEVRAEARSLADRGQFEGAGAVLKNMMQAVERSPAYTPHEGSALSEAMDQLVDEHAALARRPKAEDYRALRRSLINVSVSADGRSSSSRERHESEYAAKVERAVAGEYPPAELLVVNGPGSGRRFGLRSEQTIGRSPAVDVALPSAGVGRQHAKVFAQRGAFYVLDLGSPTGTLVNGEAVETRELNPGDKLVLGDVELEYRLVKTDADARLVAITPEGNVHVVEKDRLFVMGASPACTLVIPDVGRQHAAVRYKNGVYYFEDYGTEMGTLGPNGKKISDRVVIRDGDQFRIGSFAVRFQFRAQ